MSKLKVDELEESTSGQNITVASGTNLVVTDSLTVGGAAPYTAGGTDVAVADGGTGAGTATAGFDALSPMTTVGDIMYGGSSGTVTRLAASTDGHVLTATGAGSAPAWEAAAGGGITEINHWALDTDMTAAGTIVNGFYEPNSRGESKLGTGMTEANGVFSFPSTGHWMVQAQMTHSWIGTNDYVCLYVLYSEDNGAGSGSFVTAFEGGWQGSYANGRAATSLSGLFDITSTANEAVKFAITSEESTIWGFTNSTYSRNYFQFIRLADT